MTCRLPSPQIDSKLNYIASPDFLIIHDKVKFADMQITELDNQKRESVCGYKLVYFRLGVYPQASTQTLPPFYTFTLKCRTVLGKCRNVVNYLQRTATCPLRIMSGSVRIFDCGGGI